jgi:uncharacterized membrane protein
MNKMKLHPRFVLTMLYLMITLGIVACSRQPKYTPPARLGSDVVIEISKLNEGFPSFFTYQMNGKNISFFVVKIGNTVTSFLDACNACYPHKLGYKYENGMIICLYCREKYSMDELAAGYGNCHPIKLPGRIQDGKYLIAVSSLEKNASKF